MKKCILASLLTVLAASCFAIETSSVIEPLTSSKLIASKTPIKQPESSDGFLYVKMDVADTQVTQTPQWPYNTLFMPGLGIGYRRGTVTAIDISIGGSLKKDKGTYNMHCWSFPKMAFLRYLTPQKESSFYVGAGLNWGEISHKQKMSDLQKQRKSFLGLSPLARIGYEFNHGSKNNWRSFFELEVSQPVLAVTKTGNLPGPIAELSVALGY